jgi:hypothetical protein
MASNEIGILIFSFSPASSALNNIGVSELSEAINSTFQYCRKWKACLNRFHGLLNT